MGVAVWLTIHIFINTEYHINFRISVLNCTNGLNINFLKGWYFANIFRNFLKRFAYISCKDMNTKLWMIGRYFAAVNENISLFILMSYLISFHLSKMWCWVSFGIVFKVYAWYAWFEWMMQIIDFLSEGKVIAVFSATYK